MVKDNNSGLFIIAIVAVVAIVSLFLISGNSQTSSEEVMVVDGEGNLVGEAFRDKTQEKVIILDDDMDTEFTKSEADGKMVYWNAPERNSDKYKLADQGNNQGGYTATDDLWQ